MPAMRFSGVSAVADAAASAVAALSTPLTLTTAGEGDLVRKLAVLNSSGLLFGPRARELAITALCRLGQFDSALSLAGKLSVQDAEVGSAAWAWHSMPLEGAVAILRAAVLRRTRPEATKSLQLVKQICDARSQPIPAEVVRLAKAAGVWTEDDDDGVAGDSKAYRTGAREHRNRSRR